MTDELVGRLPALRARSDLERKRLHGLEATARTGSSVGGGLYAAAASRHTYAALADIADRLLRNGQNALIDATFLHRHERLAFRQVAASTRRVSRFSTARPRWPSCAGASRRVTARAATRRKPIAPSSSTSCSRRSLSIARNGAVTVAVDTSKPIRYEDLVSRLRRV